MLVVNCRHRSIQIRSIIVILLEMLPKRRERRTPDCRGPFIPPKEGGGGSTENEIRQDDEETNRLRGRGVIHFVVTRCLSQRPEKEIFNYPRAEMRGCAPHRATPRSFLAHDTICLVYASRGTNMDVRDVNNGALLMML